MRQTFLTVFALLACIGVRDARAAEFDFDHGNAAIDIVIQTAVPVIFTEVSPTGTAPVRPPSRGRDVPPGPRGPGPH